MKKKVKKYQIGGQDGNPCGQGTIWDDQQKRCVPDWSFGNNTTAPTNPNTVLPPTMDYSGDPARQPKGDIKANFVNNQGQVNGGYNLDSDGKYRKTVTTTDNSILGYNDTFKGLNTVLNLTQGIAGTIDNYNTNNIERQKYNKAKYQMNDRGFNPYEQGLNQVPVYTQNGGDVSVEQAKQFLANGKIRGKALTKAQKDYFGLIAGGGTPNTMQNGGGIHIKKSNEGKFTAYAKSIGMSVQEAAHHVIAHSNDKALRKEAQFAINFSHQYGGIGFFEDGGQNTPNSYSVPEDQANAETEEGEIIQQQNGNIVKTPENSGTHEEGGSFQPNVHRVLEDTSDKRKNPDSKILKITPDEAMGLVGFKPKSSVTHSKLYEQSVDFYSKKVKTAENKIKTNFEYVKGQHGGKFAENALDENIKNLQDFPTPAKLFDAIYNHQEEVKSKYSVDNSDNENCFGGKAQMFQSGGRKDPTDPNDGSDQYIDKDGNIVKLGDSYDTDGSNNESTLRYTQPMIDDLLKNGNIKPYTGTSTNKNGKYYDNSGDFKDWIDNTNSFYGSNVQFNKPLNDNPSVLQVQQQINKNNPEAVLYAYKNGLLDVNNAAPNKDVSKLSNPDILNQFADGYYVKDRLMFQNQNFKTPEERDQFIKDHSLNTDPSLKGLYTDNANGSPMFYKFGIGDNSATNNTQKQPFNYNKPSGIEASKFNEPLHWFDIAGNLDNYLSSLDRIPVDLEQYNRSPLKVHELNPLPTLLQNQGDFNAANAEMPHSGAGYANTANLLGNKYKINNEVLGQYENQNKTRFDAVDQYNNQMNMGVDQANMGLRDQFTQRVLQGKEIQRQSKLNALDDYFTKLAQNRKLNREGNLVMQLTPYFDQFAKFNGNQVQLNSAVSNMNNNTNVNGITTRTQTDANGNVTVVSTDKTGKTVRSYIIPSDRVKK